MSKIPYWIHDYGALICSECSYRIDADDGLERYLYFYKNRDKCPGCNADMREPYKRCYYQDYSLTGTISCGDVKYIEDMPYCNRQTKERREELRSWGCYYKCEGFKPKEGTA